MKPTISDTRSYWEKSAKTPEFPALQKNLEVDVVVIGAGLTGITTAYLLKKAGAKVALVEQYRCVHGDTNNTTAQLTYVTDLSFRDLVDYHGKENARLTWEAGRTALQQIATIVEEEKIDCDFRRVPGYKQGRLFDPKPSDYDKLKKEAELIRSTGFEAKFLEEVPYFKRPGIEFPNQALFHPKKYLAALLKTIPGEGCYVFENSKVTEFEEKPLQVLIEENRIKTKLIVIATHVPLQGKVGTLAATLFQTKLTSYSSYVLGAKIAPGLLRYSTYWDISEPYYYLRIDPFEGGDYAIFGGRDHKTGQEDDTEKCFQRLTEDFLSFFPEAVIDSYWSGQVVETFDGLPFIGEISPGQFIATGFTGNGMTFGTIAALMARDLFLEKENSWQKLFDVHRKSLKGGLADYLRENKDYPTYFVKDHLIKRNGNLGIVARGEGKVIHYNGKKVAAYRSDSDKLTLLTAICPHMGCIVHWNPAMKTWDCPCHGSRFSCDGKVIAGPAETDLEKVAS